MAKRGDGPSKVSMVRDAIDNLGWNAHIDKYVEYIKNKHKRELTKAYISQTKSVERRRRGVRGKSKRGRPVGSGKTTTTASIADILSFVDTIKAWEQKIGANSVRDVVKNVLKK